MSADEYVRERRARLRELQRRNGVEPIDWRGGAKFFAGLLLWAVAVVVCMLVIAFVLGAGFDRLEEMLR